MDKVVIELENPEYNAMNLYERKNKQATVGMVKQEPPEADDIPLNHEVPTSKLENASTDDQFASTCLNTIDMISNHSLVLKSETVSYEEISVKEELLHEELNIKSEDETIQETHADDKQNLENKILTKFAMNQSLELKMETVAQDQFESDQQNISIKQELLHEELDIKSDDETIKESCLDNKYNLGNQLGKHKRLVSGVKPFKPFQTCDYRSSQKGALKTHLITHTGDKLFKCEICDYSCGGRSNLRRHLRSHTGEKPFNCNICEKSFTRKDHLNTHLITHTGEKSFKCNICGYSCGRKGVLKIHLITHTGEKPFKCEICGYSCGRKGDLKKHLMTHTGEKPFKCEICDYSCGNKSNLMAHLITHTGEKRFNCNICDKSFTLKGNLKMHLITHTGEKPFKCIICGYSCGRKSELKIHLMTRNGGKPFKCKFCHYNCIRKCSLKPHMRSYHKEHLPVK